MEGLLELIASLLQAVASFFESMGAGFSGDKRRRR
jgi:hypothetical protein